MFVVLVVFGFAPPRFTDLSVSLEGTYVVRLEYGSTAPPTDRRKHAKELAEWSTAAGQGDYFTALFSVESEPFVVLPGVPTSALLTVPVTLHNATRTFAVSPQVRGGVHLREFGRGRSMTHWAVDEQVTILDEVQHPITPSDSTYVHLSLSPTSSTSSSVAALYGTVNRSLQSDGRATFNDLYVNVAGNYNLTATVFPYRFVSTPVSIVVQPDVPAALRVATQPGFASATSVFGRQPIVHVIDIAGNIVTYESTLTVNALLWRLPSLIETVVDREVSTVPLEAVLNGSSDALLIPRLLGTTRVRYARWRSVGRVQRSMTHCVVGSCQRRSGAVAGP